MVRCGFIIYISWLSLSLSLHAASRCVEKKEKRNALLSNYNPTFQKIVNLYPDINIDNHIDLSYNRDGQDIRYALNDSKLQSLGWKPKKNFNDEIIKIVEYYKNKFIW